MRKILNWMKEEALLAIPAIIYFVISFNLINFTERLLLRGEGLSSGFFSYLTATIAALIVVKILLIVNTLPHFNLFPKEPHIFNIAYKFLLYGSASIVFRLLDSLIDFYFKFHNDALIWQHISVKLHSPIFWAVELWVLMLFLGYIVVAELANDLGKKKTMRLLFGKHFGAV